MSASCTALVTQASLVYFCPVVSARPMEVAMVLLPGLRPILRVLVAATWTIAVHTARAGQLVHYGTDSFLLLSDLLLSLSFLELLVFLGQFLPGYAGYRPIPMHPVCSTL